MVFSLLVAFILYERFASTAHGHRLRLTSSASRWHPSASLTTTRPSSNSALSIFTSPRCVIDLSLLKWFSKGSHRIEMDLASNSQLSDDFIWRRLGGDCRDKLDELRERTEAKASAKALFEQAKADATRRFEQAKYDARLYGGTFTHPAFEGTVDIIVSLNRNEQGEWATIQYKGHQKHRMRIFRGNTRKHIRMRDSRTVLDGYYVSDGIIEGVVVQDGDEGGFFRLELLMEQALNRSIISAESDAKELLRKPNAFRDKEGVVWTRIEADSENMNYAAVSDSSVAWTRIEADSENANYAAVRDSSAPGLNVFLFGNQADMFKKLGLGAELEVARATSKDLVEAELSLKLVQRAEHSQADLVKRLDSMIADTYVAASSALNSGDEDGARQLLLKRYDLTLKKLAAEQELTEATKRVVSMQTSVLELVTRATEVEQMLSRAIVSRQLGDRPSPQERKSKDEVRRLGYPYDYG